MDREDHPEVREGLGGLPGSLGGVRMPNWMTGSGRKLSWRYGRGREAHP